MKRWKIWTVSVIGTLAAAGIWWAAAVAHQADVSPPPMPIAAIQVDQWQFTNAYATVICEVLIQIPKGFVCDLASIPDEVDDILKIWRDSPSVRRAAACHDYLYRTKKVSREMADWLLWQGCLADGMHPDKARAIWKAVDLWGWKSWNTRNVPKVVE